MKECVTCVCRKPSPWEVSPLEDKDHPWGQSEGGGELPPGTLRGEACWSGSDHRVLADGSASRLTRVGLSPQQGKEPSPTTSLPPRTEFLSQRNVRSSEPVENIMDSSGPAHRERGTGALASAERPNEGLWALLWRTSAFPRACRPPHLLQPVTCPQGCVSVPVSLVDTERGCSESERVLKSWPVPRKHPCPAPTLGAHGADPPPGQGWAVGLSR